MELNDIEDMYLEKVKGNIRHFTRDLQYNFISALLIYIRRLIVQERVENLQLGVESYQVKLNLTKPQLTCPDIEEMSQYVHVPKPFGFTYLNDERKLRFMRYDELHKFCNSTLKSIRDGLVKR